jgi:Winged helix DNA-binding domain
MTDEHRERILTNLGQPTVLIDGFVRGTWKTEQTSEKATLVFEPFERLPEKDRDALTEEGGTARPLRGGARGHRGGRGSIRRENLENHRPSHHRRNPARTAVVSGPPWISKPSRYSCTHPDRTVMLYTRRGVRAR